MHFALSTSWNAASHTSGKELIFEIKALGFDEAELSFNLTPLMVNEIAELVSQHSISITSLHNYCPIPIGLPREIALPDYYAMSSPKQDERESAVLNTKKTIETAARLGARAVVLHCGRVEIPDKTREMIKIYSGGLKNPQEFLRLREQATEERSACAGKFLDNTLKSLEELNSYAAKHSVRIGIENRFYYREIPSLQEIGIILDKFKGSNIFYWHDTGHAQVMENLGFATHKEYLDRYSASLIGIHLHDIAGCNDHLAPGEGRFDFGMLRQYLKPDTINVIEAHRPANAETVRKSREFLNKIL